MLPSIYTRTYIYPPKHTCLLLSIQYIHYPEHMYLSMLSHTIQRLSRNLSIRLLLIHCVVISPQASALALETRVHRRGMDALTLKLKCKTPRQAHCMCRIWRRYANSVTGRVQKSRVSEGGNGVCPLRIQEEVMVIRRMRPERERAWSAQAIWHD